RAAKIAGDTIASWPGEGQGSGSPLSLSARSCLTGWGLMAFKRNQRMRTHTATALQPRCTAELWQIDYESSAGYLAAQTADQLNGGLGCAACCNQIVDNQDALTLFNCVLVHLDDVGAIFELIILPDGAPGQLALLADGDETGAEPLCHGA